MSSGSAPAALRGWAPLLLATLLAAPFPTQAACTGNPNARVDPLSQTVPETTGGAPTVVVLDGSKSTPNQPDLGYAWQYLGSTPSGFTVSLSGANTATASFAAPNVPVGGASLQFRLTVTCGTRTSSTTTTINVTDVVVNTPPTPVAVAVPENAAEGTLVTLDGSASYDLDPGTTLSYQWTQIGGSPTVLLSSANPAGSIVTFVAPNLPATTSLTFRLTVSDGSLSASANRIVNILWSNDPPVASLVCPGGLIEADEGALVTLDGSGSSDPDGTIASYTWDQYAGLPNLGLGAHATPTIAFSAPALGYQQTGALQVRLTVTDDQGASASAECGLFVHDVTPPLITVPGDLTVEADSAAGAAVSYAVTAQDAVDDEFPYPLACTPPSGSVFPLAAAPAKALATPVACAATDSAGNTANAGFTITVQDTTPPVITVPGALGVEATGADGAVAHFDATTLDVVDGAGVADCTPPSGSTFPLGDTTVTCTASDARGNPAAPAAFILTVHDTTPPTIEPHADLGPIEATGPSGAVVTYTSPATTDLVDGVGTATCLPASGSTFPLGTSTVTCTAADAAGNAATPTQFQVTVADTTPPVIAAHADVGPVEAAGPDGAVVSYDSPATSDLVDGPGVASCTPASGTLFPLGTSTVTCTAADAAGNAAAPTQFQVTVADTTPPTIAPHADVGPVEATGPGGAIVGYLNPATFDVVDGAGIATCAPAAGSLFPLGTSTVTCTAADAAGNAAAPVHFRVLVVDTTPPVIAPHADLGPIEATGPSGAVVTYTSPATTDLVDGVGTATCLPASGSTFPLGTSTVTCTAADVAGNAATPTQFQVTVADTTPPVIAAHADVSATAASSAGAVVSYTPPTATDLVDGPVAVTCTPASGSTFPVGPSTVQCSATDNAGNTGNSSFIVQVSYAWTGFFRPVDNAPTLNTVRAGSAVPVKFSLGGDMGLAIFAAGHPRAALMACASGAVEDVVEETVTAGGSTLTYDAVAKQYVYVWKTDKAWAGSCRQLQIRFADGSLRVANFKLTK